MKNNLVEEFNAEKEALKLYNKFLLYVNDDKDIVFELIQINTKKANAKQCALIALAEKMKTAITFKGCRGLQSNLSNLISMKIELEKI